MGWNTAGFRKFINERKILEIGRRKQTHDKMKLFGKEGKEQEKNEIRKEEEIKTDSN